MDKLLSEGQFPPRWSGELNNGYGYPVFLFNYPLPALVGEVFHKTGLGYVDSVKAVLFVSMILSVLGMYLFLKSFLGLRLAALLGAIFYLYAPLRFLNVYVAAAVGAALGGALVPFVVWSMVKVTKSQKWVWVGALFFALLILAHNVTALIFSSLILAFAGLLIWQSKDRWNLGKRLALMFILGLGLSAWFWLPAILEKQYIRFNEVYAGFYKDQFVSLWQLLRSPWGYGLSHPQNPEPGNMSYQLGLVQIAVMICWIPFLWAKRGIREIRVIGIFIVSFFLLSIFLMLKISLPVWERLPFLSLVQFPLRFEALAILLASMAAALLVKYLPNRRLIFICLLVLVIYANRNHWNINQVFDPGENYYLSLKTTTASYNEHLPKWGRVMPKEPSAKLEIIRGIGEIRVIQDQSAQVVAEIETTASAKLRFNQFYFPGWQIQVDGKPVKFNYLTEGESYGLPVFDIDNGNHQILAEFKNTPIRNMADGIGIVSVAIWLWLILLFRGAKRRGKLS